MTRYMGPIGLWLIIAVTLAGAIILPGVEAWQWEPLIYRPFATRAIMAGLMSLFVAWGLFGWMLIGVEKWPRWKWLEPEPQSLNEYLAANPNPEPFTPHARQSERATDIWLSDELATAVTDDSGLTFYRSDATGKYVGVKVPWDRGMSANDAFALLKEKNGEMYPGKVEWAE